MMIELSKEDQERIRKEAVVHSISAIKNVDGIMGEMLARIEVISFRTGAEYEHPIAFEKGRIEGFNDRKLVMESFAVMERDRNNWQAVALEYQKRNDEKFNEGIEAARKTLWKYRLKSYHNIAEIDEELAKLKKVSNEKGTV